MRSLATVTRLAPRSGSYEDGLVAYRASRFETAIAELSRNADVRSQLLLARALIRAGRVEDGLSTAWSVPKNLSHPELAERALLIGMAETHLSAYDEARASFGVASAYAMSAHSPALFAEIDYLHGLLEQSCGNTAGFAAHAQTIVDTYVAGDEDDAYVVPLAHTRARAHAALEIAARLDNDLSHAIAHAEAAIAELEAEPIADAMALAQCYVNLAAMARDHDLPAQAAFLRSRLDAFEWSQPMQGRRFTVVTALGWCEALAGNHVGALRWFREAGTIATDVSEKIVAMLSRASLALELDHGILAEEELQFALELAGRVDWERNGDERRQTTLLHIAQVAAPTAPREARAALERYRSAKVYATVLSQLRADPRYRAEEAYAEGRIARAEGNFDVAASRLEAAFEYWSTVGFAWRASLAATELVELGGGERFAAYARAYAERRPHSWIARRFAARELAAV